MKDAADNKTVDMIDTTKKRGRPATGHAKSAAERKREQRKRDSHNISSAYRGTQEWATIPITSLCTELQQCTENGFAGLAARIMEELANRAMANEESRFKKENDPRYNDYKTTIKVSMSSKKITTNVTVTESPAQAQQAVTVTKSKAAPKYRSAKGETWSGRGQRPAWVRNHIDQGGNLADLLL